MYMHTFQRCLNCMPWYQDTSDDNLCNDTWMKMMIIFHHLYRVQESHRWSINNFRTKSINFSPQKMSQLRFSACASIEYNNDDSKRKFWKNIPLNRKFCYSWHRKISSNVPLSFQRSIYIQTKISHRSGVNPIGSTVFETKMSMLIPYP